MVNSSAELFAVQINTKTSLSLLFQQSWLRIRGRIVREVSCVLCIAKGNVKKTRLHLEEALQTFKERLLSPSATTEKAPHIPEGLQPSAMTSELLSEKHHLAMIPGNFEEGILELSHHGKMVTANKAARRFWVVVKRN